jgi:hypothetical protein
MPRRQQHGADQLFGKQVAGQIALAPLDDIGRDHYRDG